MNRLGEWLPDCLKEGWKASQEGLFMCIVSCGPESLYISVSVSPAIR